MVSSRWSDQFQAGIELRAQLLLHFFVLQFAGRSGSGYDARQSEQRNQVRFGLDAEFPPQALHGLHVGLGHLAVDFHGGPADRLVIDVHVHVAAPQAVADRLPDARFEHFEAVRHSKMKIQKPVIHAAQVDAQRATFAVDVRLREAGHRVNSGGCRGGFHPSTLGPGVAAGAAASSRIGELHFVEPRVRAAAREQFLVRAHFARSCRLRGR